MADKIKKISVNAFERCVKESGYENTTTIQWNGVDVVVKKCIPFEEMMSFVDSVVKSCFTSDNAVYVPEVKEFAVKCNLLDTYANFTLPSNASAKYELIYQSDIVNIVLGYIDREQFQEILNAIDDKIDNLVQANIFVINQRMNEVLASVEKLRNQFADIFNGVGKDEVIKLVDAMANGKFDASELMNAYFENKRQQISSEETVNDVNS